MSSARSGGVDARKAASNGHAGPRTPAQIEAEIRRTRERLANNVDQIADRVKPANVAKRGADSAKAQLVDGNGQVRAERLAAVVAVVAAVGVLMWRRSRSH
jgi:hypothetical protein